MDGLDVSYGGPSQLTAQATGEDLNVEEGEGKQPFRALLDVGLVRTTTGNRVFGALEGALDGGLDIPHSGKRFAGFSKEDKSLDAETHCKYILGGHIADYMKVLKEEEPEKYQAHFCGLLKEGFEADDLAEMYSSVHAAIRADPSAQLTEKNAPTEKKISSRTSLSGTSALAMWFSLCLSSSSHPGCALQA
ncbi:hypothetical protein BDL97_19G092100 [Sphagnum fallax]|nr:hypothetical protein BDL97_19G092100 [Sphagnum fallax]